MEKRVYYGFDGWSDEIKAVLSDFEARVAEIRFIGGISAYDVAQGVKVPAGWVRDDASDYYVPPYWTWNPSQQAN